MRVSKEQDHVLISPQGLSYAEVTGANLVSTTALFVITIMCLVDIIGKKWQLFFRLLAIFQSPSSDKTLLVPGVLCKENAFGCITITCSY